MRALIAWVDGFAAAIGGPGLFAVAFLDASFASLPQINNIFIVLMVMQNKMWVLYYVAMATFGSVAGCYVIYYLAGKGADIFLGRWFHTDQVQRGLAWYRRHNFLALIVPALLPPPVPFKLFVLMAGVAAVPRGRFVAAVALARGAQHAGIGLLAIWYGDAALELMRTRGRDIAIGLVGLIVVTAIGRGWLSHRRNAGFGLQ